MYIYIFSLTLGEFIRDDENSFFFYHRIRFNQEQYVDDER